MSSQHSKEFSSYLKQLRCHCKLTTSKLAELTGVSASYISQIENGGRDIPSPDILKKLAPTLNVSFEEIMQKAGYLSSSKTILITDEKLKKLFTNLSPAEKELLKVVNGLSEKSILLLLQTIEQIKIDLETQQHNEDCRDK